MRQATIFDFMFEKKVIKKPIRLIELFAGIGSQISALKRIVPTVESYKICEWQTTSFKGYNAIHNKDFTDYSINVSKEKIIERINGVSTDYETPLSIEKLNKKPIEWLKRTYNDCIATHNLINIMNVKGSDLEIIDIDKYEYIMTYSFPCQDLSLAGKLKGMERESGTRSGLLWEVERILKELKELPQILLMENVPEVIGNKNKKLFDEWCNSLEKLGYKNYYKILNAKDYGIPQNRKRCFMISLLGNYSYNFPSKIPLKLGLKDMLENEVDKKYTVSKKMINYLYGNTTGGKTNKFDRKKRFIESLKKTNERNIASTITTKSSHSPFDNFIIEKYGNTALNETLEKNDVTDGDFIDCYNRTIKKDIAGTITTGVDTSNRTFIAVKNATKQGYLLAEEGDGVDISGRMEYHRGTVHKGISQTSTTMGGNGIGVVIKEELAKETLCNNLIIRKLTPLECLRLMGFEDKDYIAMVNSGLSKSTLYHCAGDSIVVNVLVHIFKELL